MMSVQEYKCPNCSGALPFDSASGKMKCPYCEAEFDAEALDVWNKSRQGTEEEKTEWETYDKSDGRGEWQEGELESLVFNECPSCGAAVAGDQNTIAICCPYCGNSNIVKAQISGILKPDYVIPFKLDKAAAIKALESFQKGKFLLPPSFKTGNRIEKMQAVYVPFWLFDCNAEGKITYRATKVSSWSSGNYNFTKTDTYLCTREGEMFFEKVPADGSKHMDDELMDSLEPYDFSTMMDFNTAYLSGFLAEKYDVDAEENKERVSKRIRTSVEQIFARDITGYTSVQPAAKNINLKHGKIHYALLPVWMVTTVYQGKKFVFALNGQNGRLAGTLPVSKGRSALMIFSLFAAFTAVFSIIARFIF